MKKLIKKILKEHVIIAEEVAPEEVHRAADKVGMEWDDNEEFMDFSEKVTGERHIDDMSSKLRKKLIKKILKEQFYSDDTRNYIDGYASSYNDFGDPKFLKHILKELDRSIIIEDVVAADGIETDWVAWLEEDPFGDHLCYGCRGIYHYPNTGDLNRVVDHEDNDQLVSAISIMLENIFGGDDWMVYYYIIHKYLQDRISKYMKDGNYPYKHTIEW
jgi:hypothetical protein